MIFSSITLSRITSSKILDSMRFKDAKTSTLVEGKLPIGIANSVIPTPLYENLNKERVMDEKKKYTIMSQRSDAYNRNEYFKDFERNIIKNLDELLGKKLVK